MRTTRQTVVLAPCCRTQLRPTHKMGDRAVACPGCGARLVVRATPYEVEDYRADIDKRHPTEGQTK